DRAVPLPDEAPDDLDAVAAEVDDRPATGQPPIPEPGTVRTGVRLARPDPGHVAEGPACHGRDRLERLRRIAEVLEIAAEYAGPLDRIEDPAGLLVRPPERLRLQH